MPVSTKRVSWWFGLTFLVAGAALLLAMGPGAAQETHDVAVGDLFFDPGVVEIEAGDTVRWSMTSGFEPHDIVAVNGSFNSHLDCDHGSGDCMGPGDTFEVTFTEPGEVAYYCSLHGTVSGLGMAGTVVVHEAEPVTGSVEGTVTDAGTGAAIAGATVSAGGESVTAGADGSYSITDLDAGPYTVTAAADGYEPGSQQATVVAGASTVVDFALAEVQAGPVLTLVWNNHFETVTDGLFVIWDQPIDAQQPADGPGTGGYTMHEAADCSDEPITQGIEGFWSGSRSMQRELIMQGWEDVEYGGTYYLRVASNTERATDTQVANAVVPCFEFIAELSPDHRSTFAGQVTDAGTGAPIAGAPVTVTRTIGLPGTVAGTATTDGDGQYLVELLSPGPYELTAEAAGYEPATVEETALRTQTVTVDFALSADVDLELVPAGSGTLHGREIVEEQTFLGLPCPWDVARTVYRVRGIGTYEGVDAAGDRVVYEATIGEGETLHQHGPLRVDVESTVAYRHGPGGTYAHEDATCQNPGYEVSAQFEIFSDGHVHDGDGQPCVGEGFFARVANGVWHAEWTLLTDCVVEGGGGSGVAPAGSTHTMDGVHVPGTGADLGRNIRLDYEQFLLLPAGGGPDSGAIAGTVTDADSGDPIAGATVTADDETTTTAADGTYTIAGLEPGEYAVTARAAGYLFTSTRIRTVEAGETTTVDFALDPAVPVTVGPTVGLALVAEGLTAPVQVLSAPDDSGRLFVVDQIGLIRVVAADGELLTEPFLDLRDRLVAFRPGFDERGALGLAFHPGYASNGRLFVYYSAPLRPGGPEGWDHTSHISEFAVSADANVADADSERIVLQVDQPQFNHNGGKVAFGPTDGHLYISLGDGGGSNDTAMGHTPDVGNAQDITNLLGSILRIDVDGAQPYAIPAGNPFVGTEGRDEIFAYGFRNPYRFSFDQGGDHALMVGDAGQGLWEEVNLVTGGGNYGWNIKEGTHCFNPAGNLQMPEDCPDVGHRGESLIDPVIEYPHIRQPGGVGVVVVGGHVYRGSDVPYLQGQYFFGDWSTSFGAPNGTLLVAEPQASGLWPVHEVAVKDRPDGRLGHYLLGFGQDDAGEVYVLTSDSVSPSGDTGKVYRITADTDAGEVAGTVIDADSGDPIAGATVTAGTASATTGADGTYAIGGLAAGDYTVTVDADGYESASQAATVAEGQTATADFALDAVVVEPTTGSIVGTVTDADSGDPVAGATVSAAGQSATTGADGSYLIDEVDAGTYTVTASAAGYVSASQTAAVVAGGSTTVDFALDAVVVDPEPTDPASRSDCMNGGWSHHGFRNQGLCIQFVNTGKDSR